MLNGTGISLENGASRELLGQNTMFNPLNVCNHVFAPEDYIQYPLASGEVFFKKQGGLVPLGITNHSGRQSIYKSILGYLSFPGVCRKHYLMLYLISSPQPPGEVGRTDVTLIHIRD